MNDYYILAAGQLNILDNTDVVESLDTVRYNKTGTKFICKTKVGISNAPFMNPNTVLTHAQVLVELAKPEWNNEEI